jgi:microcystin-dependent protein
MTPYIGEIRMAAFDFAPERLVFCNGAELNIDSDYRINCMR